MTSLVKSEWLSDWFVIDEYESAQPEGRSAEWREILEAMKRRESKGFRRVAVRFDKGFAEFTSPRNSIVSCEALLVPTEIDEFIAAAELVLDLDAGMLHSGDGI